MLSRRAGEYIDITCPCGRTIVVCLSSATDGRARIGFEADRAIRIDRREVKGSRVRTEREAKALRGDLDSTSDSSPAAVGPLALTERTAEPKSPPA